MGGKRRPRRAVSSVVAALFLSSASSALAQRALRRSPRPTAPPSSSQVGKPDVPPSEPGRAGQGSGPAHAAGRVDIDLTTLETKNLDLLYFDPLQTYVTPYIARVRECARLPQA